MKIAQKIFFSHFGHYLIRACCDIWLISVRDATNQVCNVLLVIVNYRNCLASQQITPRSLAWTLHWSSVQMSDVVKQRVNM